MTTGHSWYKGAIDTSLSESVMVDNISALTIDLGAEYFVRQIIIYNNPEMPGKRKSPFFLTTQ